MNLEKILTSSTAGQATSQSRRVAINSWLLDKLLPLHENNPRWNIEPGHTANCTLYSHLPCAVGLPLFPPNHHQTLRSRPVLIWSLKLAALVSQQTQMFEVPAGVTSCPQGGERQENFGPDFQRCWTPAAPTGFSWSCGGSEPQKNQALKFSPGLPNKLRPSRSLTG